ncbi:MAG: sugar phosphate isomerase/epimerase family protein [Pirellulaceae bacterium]
MSQTKPTARRNFLTTFGVASATVAALQSAALRPAAAAAIPAEPLKLRYCLNTSTINGGELPIRQQLKIAADAGYDAVELWVRDIDKYVSEGGKLGDLHKEIADLGLSVESSIAFGKWIVDNDVERAAGLAQSKRDMETVRAIGGLRIAAPPVGATNQPGLDLQAAADRYRALLEVGRECEVLPQIELWGFSKNLSTLAEVLYIAAAANDADACILLDVYHMYKGGSDFSNIGLVPGAKMHCLHINDYPDMPRDQINDKDRVYPGDGIAPLGKILKSLVAGGFSGTLSLELFNRNYWAQPPEQVAKTGLEKTRAAVAAALS